MKSLIIGISEKNKEGLTWAEWSAAAGLPPTAEAAFAWRAGEDPTEWRASKESKQEERP